jgi:serine protease AprX
MRKSFRFLSILAALALAAAPVKAAKVIIRSAKPYDALVQKIRSVGGVVSYQYRYIQAIAADIPDSALSAIQQQLPPGSVLKDQIVNLPQSPRDRNGARQFTEYGAGVGNAYDAAGIASLPASSPGAYLVNNVQMDVSPLHAAGFTGNGVKVAIIDSGIRPGFPHISLDGSVIGGEDFVNDGLGFSNFANNGHGTFVAGMISANVVFSFGSTSSLLKAVKAYCPSCVVGSAQNQVPMIGSAPLSSLYALRVFPPSGGAPETRIIAAAERVLALKDNYLKGMPETQNPDGSFQALNISVCNMSLGGSTIFAGRDLEDELTQAFLDRNIVLVVSAGNAGPSGATVGSPGTAFHALTVGAASDPIHERILEEALYGAGFGAKFRPFNAIQTAYFSSRGPDADGRNHPDVVANGVACYGQGFSSTTLGISLGDGTSFSAPSVSGVAAVLRQAKPLATARQIRNAIILSANPAMVADGSEPSDRGAGFVDAAAALALLNAGEVPDTPGAGGGDNKSVKVNVLQGAGIQTVDGNVTRTVTGLLPGQRFETWYQVTPNTQTLVVTVSGVTPGPVQNVLFGDDILLTIHSPKTSAIGEGDYKAYEFTKGGTFVIPAPELGLMRITLNGDWTNASPISATVGIYSLKDSLPQMTSHGKVADGDLLVVPFQVTAGTGSLAAHLEWDADWGSYPTNDVDLLLVAPDGKVNYDGATLNDPEVAVISKPAPGNWLAVVSGYTVYTAPDNYKLRIAVDGNVIH